MATKGTPTYVIFTAETLGRGAIGTVYLARNKKNGHKFAAKIFDEGVGMAKYMQKELDVVAKIPEHRNIIKFVKVEEEIG